MTEEEVTPRPGPGLRLLAAVVLAAVIGVVGGGLAAWGIYVHLGPAQRIVEQLVPGPSNGRAQTVGQIAEAAASSLVVLATQPATAGEVAGGAGGFANGVVVSADGLILTSAHAVRGATQLRVGLSSGKGYEAVIAGTDQTHGLVLLRAVGASSLTPIPLASTPPSVGDTAFIVYSSPGSGLSVGVGTVSATGERLTADSASGTTVSGVITIDTTPEPEADGGLVLNSEGQMTGIVTGSTGTGSAAGLTALSLTAARDLISQVTGGSAQPQPTFGVATIYLDPAHAAAEGLPAGALVTGVTPGGPAAQAGIEVGDIVTGVNGTAIDAAQAFDPSSLGLAPGASAEVIVVRGDATLSLTMRVGTG